MTIKKSQLHPAKALARHLGGRLARRRRELGMTAADLDKSISVPAGSVSRLEAEAKRMDAVQLYTLSRALDVPMMYFLKIHPSRYLPILVTRRGPKPAKRRYGSSMPISRSTTRKSGAISWGC